MRRLLLAASLCSLLVAPALANPVLLKFKNSYGTTAGGEFSVDLAPGSGAFNPVTLVKDGQDGGTHLWTTFCLERGETLDFSSVFKVAGLSTTAMAGGVAGPGGDPISVGTAWLFTEFSLRRLTGYNYNNGALRPADADALQKAIWALEGESGGDVNSFYYLLAKAQFGGTDAAVKADYLSSSYYSSNSNVRVVNLVYNDQNGTKAQDVLVLIPAPGAALLALIGLPVVGWVRRRLA